MTHINLPAETQKEPLRLSVVRFGAAADTEVPQTAPIQAAIDAAGAAGGGEVRIPQGRFVSGRLHLRSGVHLVLEEGAVLAGSSDWRDYGPGTWTDALITGTDVHGVRISGPGCIDGVALQRPGGEEGFRGPHAVLLSRVRSAGFHDLTIRRAGNYGVYCRDASGLAFERLKVLEGHDALHIQNCEDVAISDCDLRTGDDCIAGTDNRRVSVTGTRLNSSCNAFRLGAAGLVVSNCVFQGPGEFTHQVSAQHGKPRHNMLAAFVHFSPTDRNPQYPSDDWLITDCTMDQVQSVYAYDHSRGIWQTGQPAKRLRFRNIRATRVARPVVVVGDSDRQLDLTLDNVAIALDAAAPAQAVINIRRFGVLRFRRLELVNDGTAPLAAVTDGDRVEWIESPDPALLRRVTVGKVGAVVLPAAPSAADAAHPAEPTGPDPL